MKYLSNKLINTLLGVVLLMGLIWFISAKLFPEDIDVKPVLKDSTEIQKEAEKLNKKVIQDEDIETIKPIGDIPIIKRLQSNKQQTDTGTRTTGQSNQVEYSGNIEIKQGVGEAGQESSTTWEEPASVEQSSAYSRDGINEQIICSINELEKLNYQDPSLAYRCFLGIWILDEGIEL